MPLKIDTRIVNDILLIDVFGELALEAGGADFFYNKVRQLLTEGGQKIVVNLTHVSFFDSAGVGALIRARASVEARGGTIRLLCPESKQVIRGVLQITKVGDLFDVFCDETLALTSFESALYSRCPSCRSLSRPPLLDSGLLRWPEQFCGTCDARYSVEAVQEEQGLTLIKNFRVQTYEQEYFEIIAGPPYAVRVVGRLNLFASSALDKVWRTTPSPRRVIFDLGSATDIDAPGREALLRFLRKKESSAKAVISLEGLKPELARFFLTYPDVYPDRKAALAALGDLSDTPPWTAEIVDKA